MQRDAPIAVDVTRRLRTLVATIVGALTYLAYQVRFVQDDAFISFRYADHLAQGHGLVWNIGEPPLEGFTNLLWTLVLACIIKLGGDVVEFSWLLGLGFYAGTLLCVWEAVLRIARSRAWALVALLAVGLNYSLRAYATGGLETSLLTFLLSAATLVLVRIYESPAPRRQLCLLSALLGMAIATRLDAGLFAAPLGLTAAMIVRNSSAEHGHRRRAMIALLVPVSAMVTALVVFKMLYFGDIVPNTFYVKGASSKPIREEGLRYVWAFCLEYWLLPIVVAALTTLRRCDLHWTPRVALGLGLTLWIVYVVYVGGDFMEFRMLVPLLPLLACFCAYAARLGRATSLAFAALAALTMLASHKFEQRYSEAYWIAGLHDVETIHSLSLHVGEPVQDWRGVGRALNQHFEGLPVTIAVAAAGAIPYYSGLRTIDLHGLNDRWVAHHGQIEHHRPGHQRVAPLSYLIRQHVNLVVHPWALDDPERLTTHYGLKELQRYVALNSLSELPEGTQIIEMPISKIRSLRVLYLVRDRRIDRKIAELGWRVLHPANN